MKTALRFKIGRVPNHDFQIYLGDQEITDKVDVKWLSLFVDADSGPTEVDIGVYADEIELLPEVLRVHVVSNDNVRPSLLARLKKLFRR